MDIFFMRGTKLLGKTNGVVVPRVGDFIAAGDIKVVVKEVVWHLDNTIWVEIQV